MRVRRRRRHNSLRDGASEANHSLNANNGLHPRHIALAGCQWHTMNWPITLEQMPPRRKLVKHVHEPGDLHEFTFSTFKRRPLLTNDQWRGYLAESIDRAAEQFGFHLIAFVFMPEHVHLLTWPLEIEPAIPRYLAAVKRPVSVRVKADLAMCRARLLRELTVQERPGKVAFRFWQEGPGYDRNFNKPKSILAAIDYIHANPVRRGLCTTSTAWPWSSARWYATDGQCKDARLPKLTPLPVEFGWRMDAK
jgi:putative transposase